MYAQPRLIQNQRVRNAFLLMALHRVCLLFALLAAIGVAGCLANFILPDPAATNSWMYTELHFHPLPLQTSDRAIFASIVWLAFGACFGVIALLARGLALRIEHQLETQG